MRSFLMMKPNLKLLKEFQGLRGDLVVELGVLEMELCRGLKEVHIRSLQILEVFIVLLPLNGHLAEILLQRPLRFQQRLQRFKKPFQRHLVLQKLLQICFRPNESLLVLQEHLGL